MANPHEQKCRLKGDLHFKKNFIKYWDVACCRVLPTYTPTKKVGEHLYSHILPNTVKINPFKHLLIPCSPEIPRLLQRRGTDHFPKALRTEVDRLNIDAHMLCGAAEKPAPFKRTRWQGEK